MMARLEIAGETMVRSSGREEGGAEWVSKWLSVVEKYSLFEIEKSEKLRQKRKKKKKKKKEREKNA
jgi:hypothetical protein